MKKQLIQFMFTALTFGMLVSLNTMATENAETKANSSIEITQSGNVSLNSNNAQQEEVKAFQLSLKVEPDENAKDVVFNFNQENNIKISEYRYHADTNTMNIYVADSEPVFKGSDLINIGEVTATDENGSKVDTKISVPKNALKMVAQDNINEEIFTVENETEIPEEQTTESSATPEATTTTTAEPNSNDTTKIEKTYDSSYMINIPEGSDNLKAGQIFELSARNVRIAYGKSLAISVTSENEWHLMDKNTKNKSGILYHMAYGESETNISNKTETILTIGNGAETGNVNLTVTSVDEADLAGTFADTLTFNVNLIG